MLRVVTKFTMFGVGSAVCFNQYLTPHMAFGVAGTLKNILLLLFALTFKITFVAMTL